MEIHEHKMQLNMENREDLFLSRSRRSKQFLGKLRSDSKRLEYCIYDQGDNPEDIESDCEIDDEIRQELRVQLGVIRYRLKKVSAFDLYEYIYIYIYESIVRNVDA
jgi:hypothetical protein